MAESILDEAKRLVYGDRNAAYGTPTENMANIARLVNEMLGLTLKGSDIAMILVQVKMGRLKYAYKKDSVIDICGYMDIYDRCKEAEKNGKVKKPKRKGLFGLR